MRLEGDVKWEAIFNSKLRTNGNFVITYRYSHLDIQFVYILISQSSHTTISPERQTYFLKMSTDSRSNSIIYSVHYITFMDNQYIFVSVLFQISLVMCDVKILHILSQKYVSLYIKQVNPLELYEKFHNENFW